MTAAQLVSSSLPFIVQKNLLPHLQDFTTGHLPELVE
jgi:hypothetical protein